MSKDRDEGKRKETRSLQGYGVNERVAPRTRRTRYQYRGFLLPTTEATTGPEWNPALICTVPRPGWSGSMGESAAAATAARENLAMRAAWSGCVEHSQLKVCLCERTKKDEELFRSEGRQGGGLNPKS